MPPFDIPALSEAGAEDLLQAATEVLSSLPLPAGGEADTHTVSNRGSRQLPGGMPRVIGLSGKPRSGKDVVAHYLEENYSGVQRVNFSDPIIAEVNRWLAPDRKITPANKSHPLHRHLLQAWGASRREERADYWTAQLGEMIQELLDDGIRLVVVCGVRTETDLALVESLHAPCWMVERPGNTYQAEHAIENTLGKIDKSRFQIILNPVEGDLAPYHANIEARLDAWR